MQTLNEVHSGLKTVTAKRVKETTGTYKGFNKTEYYLDGELFATIPASSAQPRKDKKVITLNCFRYLVQWQNKEA